MIRVYRKKVRVPDNLVARLRQRAICTGGQVFNPDDRRLQAPLRTDSPIVMAVRDVLDRRRLLARRRVGGAVVMHSTDGCKQQQWHTDYDPKVVPQSTTKPMGVIVALEDDTRFLTPDRTYRLDKGDVLCFSGDVVHAGSAYARHNTRIHVYLDVDRVQRPRNKTWLVDDEDE